MIFASENLPGDFVKALDELAEAADSDKKPVEFWPVFLSSLGGISGAAFAVLMLRASTNGHEWKTIGLWPRQPGASEKSFLSRTAECAHMAAGSRACLMDLDSRSKNAAAAYAAGVRVPTEAAEGECVACFLLDGTTREGAEQALQRLALTAETASIYQLRKNLHEARLEVERTASAADLIAVLNQHKKFFGLSVALCNEIANRHGCERVSLGWYEASEYMRLVAISHTEKFERKMDVISRLEAAMDEALEQDTDVFLPAGENVAFIFRDHQAYADLQGISHLVSLPLRLDGECLGVITCEREEKPFSESDLRLLRVCVDLCTRRLYEVKRHDRWFGARLWTQFKEWLGSLLGPSHTFAKAVSIVLSILLLWFLFGTMNYRVEGTFSIKTEHQAQIPAPFDGYILSVKAETGDEVAPDATLLDLDTANLKLEEATLSAELNRYRREAEKARAEDRLADMRIANALADESEANLGIIRFRLDHARISSPISGVVVDGDHHERIGSPVQTGEVLYRVARLDDLYVECEVEERDVHKLVENAKGEIAFASRPKLKFPVIVERIYPAAQTAEGGNVFLLRCKIDCEVESWWRPGMTGIAKLEAGRRKICWVYTHKTVDFLRMWMWK